MHSKLVMVLYPIHPCTRLFMREKLWPKITVHKALFHLKLARNLFVLVSSYVVDEVSVFLVFQTFGALKGNKNNNKKIT